MSQVAVLIPLMRPHKIAPLVANIAETTSDCEIIVIATGECADATRDLPVVLVEDEGGTWPQRINAGYKFTNASYIMTGADDLLFHPDWFQAAMRAMDRFPNSSGVVAVNDLHNKAGTHFVMARSYIQEFGASGDGPDTLMCEEYAHQYCDDEIRSVARKHERWAIAEDSVVEHLHVGAGKAPMDETYRIGEATASQGLAVYSSRAHLWAI